jgi:hypothetical protein
MHFGEPFGREFTDLLRVHKEICDAHAALFHRGYAERLYPTVSYEEGSGAWKSVVSSNGESDRVANRVADIGERISAPVCEVHAPLGSKPFPSNLGKQFMSETNNEHQHDRSARLVGLAMGMHAFHLVVMAVALFGLAALVIYWMLGTPAVMQFPSRIIMRFALLQIALWGIAALVTGVVGKRLQTKIDSTVK